MKTVLQLLLQFIFCAISYSIPAQVGPCNSKDTMVIIDFGNAVKTQNMSLSGLRHYKRVYGSCPNDGNYAFASYIRDCFEGRWIDVGQDHTTYDKEGKMMIINASEKPGVFFSLAINGLPPGKTCELAAWLMNICKYTDGCKQVSPNISVFLESGKGKSLAKYNVGALVAIGIPVWKRYQFLFTTPKDGGPVIIKLMDNSSSGCGNDFALDDITIIQCIDQTRDKMDPPDQVMPVTSPVTKTTEPVINPVKKEELLLIPPQKKETIPVIEKQPPKEKPVITRPAIQVAPVLNQLPEPLRVRANPLVKRIITGETTMMVELYDNATIDGDTVSVYHNNELIIDHAALSDQAIRFNIPVDAGHPHHELIMVANNLGSIPPNTSLMIITAKSKRYEVFISSDEGKNAKLVFDLEQ